jgi:hypothetical protein
MYGDVTLPREITSLTISRCELSETARQNHNIKIACCLVALLGLIGLLGRATFDIVQEVQAQETGEQRKKEIIQSEGFILVDSKGNRRARLVMEAGIPCLTFLSVDGKVAGRLAVGQRPEYVRSWPEEKRMRLEPPNDLYLYDAAGVPRTSVQLHNGLNVYDEKGRLEIRMSSDGVRVFDEEKVALMSSTGIELYEGNSKRRVLMNSINGLRLYNIEGKECAGLQAGNGLRLYDSKGSSSVSLQSWIGLRLFSTGRSGLRLLGISSYDNAKRCRWSLDGNDGLIFYDTQGKPKIHSGPGQAKDK